MNIIINTTTINIGGGLQVAYSVIRELSQMKINDRFLILCSKVFYKQIGELSMPENFTLFLIHESPAKLRTRREIIKELNSKVTEFNAEVVLTVFGPSYWKPRINHICGFADGWCYYPDTIAYTQLSFSEKIKRKLLSWYKLKHLKSETNHFFIETEDARKSLSKIAGISLDRISTVKNTYSSFFDEKKSSNELILPENKNTIRFLVLSANYPHKNISILNKVVPLLKMQIKSFEFITTIPHDEYKKTINKDIRDRVLNIGSIEVQKCVQLYKEVNYLFLPTLLETFTATYPEAMKMEVPILTSDLSFAKDICGDAAVYFDPLNAKDIVEKICNVINSPEKIKELIKAGKRQIKMFPTAAERASLLLDLCHKVNSQ